MTTSTLLDEIDHPAIGQLRERCEIIPVTKDGDEKAWLAARQRGLGGSDIGTALGLNPYSSPLTLWLEKTGQIPPEDLSDREAVKWGVRLEDIVAKAFAEETGYQVFDPRCMFVHRDHPELRANPDRLYIDHQDQLGVLECKTGDWRTGDYWAGDSTPPWYEAQGGHYQGVLGLSRSRIAVLLGGNDFQIRDPEFGPEHLAGLEQFALDWWQNHVVDGVQPDIDGSESTRRSLNAMWEIVEGTLVLDDDELDLVRELAAAKAAEKAAEARVKLIGNRLRDLLGDFEAALHLDSGDKPVFTNKRHVRTTIDWELVAADMAALGGVDPYDFVTDEHRTDTPYRQLVLGRSKAVKDLLQPPQPQEH